MLFAFVKDSFIKMLCGGGRRRQLISSVPQHDLRRDGDGELSGPGWVCVCVCGAPQRRPTHLAEPVPEGGGAGEDGGLLHLVAALRGHKAGDALKVPPAVGAAAAERPPRVALSGGERSGENPRAGSREDARRTLGGGSRTLQPDTTSPPAQIMVVLTTEPHQSLRLHTACCTTGSSACCSRSGIGP